MNFSEMQIAEKKFFNVVIGGGDWGDETAVVELLTGDFNEEAVFEITSVLENAEYPNSEKYPEIAAAIWGAISGNGALPNFEGITIEEIVTEPYFSHNGCDIRNDGVGGDVYDCIAYKDAKKIKYGEYWDVEVSGEALCEYHNGE